MMKSQITCAAVLTGALGLCMLAGANREAPLVGHHKLASHVPNLEVEVAQHPEDAVALESLVRQYLDRGAPGLALAAIQRAPEATRRSPGVSHQWAVALLHEGQASHALSQERLALSGCLEHDCAPWLLASAMRHEQFLAELVKLGVEDYRRDPEAAVAAYGRLSGGLVAVLDSSQFAAQ